MEKEQKNYEIGFLTRTEGDKNEIIKALEEQKISIAKSGGLSKIKLAYRFRKSRRLILITLFFQPNRRRLKKSAKI